MKSKEEVRKLAEKTFPYNPYDDTLFPGVRQARLEGFTTRYLIGSFSQDNLRQAIEAGNSDQSFEEFLKGLI
jgi:hypothetical protein